MLALSACGGGDETVDGSTENSNEESTLAKIEEADKFVVGVKFDTRLFGLKDPASGEVEGFDIDIAKEIAKELLGDENKIELKEVTSKTRIPLLDNGQIDAIIATMTITEERKRKSTSLMCILKQDSRYWWKKAATFKELTISGLEQKCLQLRAQLQAKTC